MPKLERLAQELETIHDRQEELKPLIDKVRDDTADRDLLFQEMIHLKLGFFAYKLKEGYYDQNPLEEEPKAQLNPQPLPPREDENSPKPAEEVKTPPTEEPKVQEEVKPAEPEPQKPKPGMTTTETLSQVPQEPVKPDPNTLPDCPACLGHKPHTKQHPDQV